MTVTIGKRIYPLSPRRAADVLNLAAAAENQEELGIKSVIAIAQIVNDSIKATGLEKNFLIRFMFYRKFIKGAVNLILHSLTTGELGEAYSRVLALEGVKKKVVQKENQSGETEVKV